MNKHTQYYRVFNESVFFNVHTVNGIILDIVPTKNSITFDTFPKMPSFIGQPLDNLASWMQKQSKTQVILLESH